MADYWSWNNALDAAGVSLESVSGSAGDLDVANIRDPRVGRIWRSGSTPNELRVALPATAGISIVGIFGANLSAVGSLTVWLGSEPGVGDVWQGEIDPLLQPTAPQAVWVLRDSTGALAPVAAAHVTVKAAGIVPLEIGRLWVGGADWQPRVGHTVESGWQVRDLSSVTRTPRSGSRLVDRAARRPVFTAAYDALYPEEYNDALRRMDRDRGLASQMLFVPNPDIYDPTEFAVLGGLVDLPETKFLGFLRGGRTMTILEDG